MSDRDRDDDLEAIERLKKQWFESRGVPDPATSPPYARRSDVENATCGYEVEGNVWRLAVDGEWRELQLPRSLRRWAVQKIPEPTEELSPDLASENQEVAADD